jgi:hypothetical protein
VAGENNELELLMAKNLGIEIFEVTLTGRVDCIPATPPTSTTPVSMSSPTPTGSAILAGLYEHPFGDGTLSVAYKFWNIAAGGDLDFCSNTNGAVFTSFFTPSSLVFLSVTPKGTFTFDDPELGLTGCTYTSSGDPDPGTFTCENLPSNVIAKCSGALDTKEQLCQDTSDLGNQEWVAGAVCNFVVS